MCYLNYTIKRIISLECAYNYTETVPEPHYTTIQIHHVNLSKDNRSLDITQKLYLLKTQLKKNLIPKFSHRTEQVCYYL